MSESRSAKKIVVMTGGTSGIGGEAAKTLARRSDVRLILGSRDPAKQDGDVIALDLESLDAVRNFSTRVIDRISGEPIHGLILNAGTIYPDISHRSADGFEMMFAVNHLAHYLLLRLLSPHLAHRAIVVITTSDTHDPNTSPVAPLYDAEAEKLAYPDRFSRPRRSAMIGMRAYGASKLCNLLTARAFAQTEQAKNSVLRVIAYSPGLTLGTALMQRSPFFLRALHRLALPALSPILKINTLESSSGALADLAIGTIEPPASKMYASLVKRRLTWPEPSEVARNDDVMRRLWKDSACMTGLPLQ